jgi:periplasmic copper chaperone A
MKLMILALAALLWGCAPEPAPPASSPPAPEQAAPEQVAPAPAGTAPEISAAWVRQVPPAARMTAGYLSIFNPGPEALVIVGAESPVFGSIEVHGTVMVDGVARMRHQESVTVPAGETVRFEPGGLHLMLMQPVNGVPSSGSIELALLLEDGERLEFLAPVGQPGG